MQVASSPLCSLRSSISGRSIRPACITPVHHSSASLQRRSSAENRTANKWLCVDASFFSTYPSSSSGLFFCQCPRHLHTHRIGVLSKKLILRPDDEQVIYKTDIGNWWFTLPVWWLFSRARIERKTTKRWLAFYWSLLESSSDVLELL